MLQQQGGGGGGLDPSLRFGAAGQFGAQGSGTGFPLGGGACTRIWVWSGGSCNIVRPWLQSLLPGCEAGRASNRRASWSCRCSCVGACRCRGGAADFRWVAPRLTRLPPTAPPRRCARAAHRAAGIWDAEHDAGHEVSGPSWGWGIASWWVEGAMAGPTDARAVVTRKQQHPAPSPHTIALPHAPAGAAWHRCLPTRRSSCSRGGLGDQPTPSPCSRWVAAHSHDDA